jgi:hypothetical protein
MLSFLEPRTESPPSPRLRGRSRFGAAKARPSPPRRGRSLLAHSSFIVPMHVRTQIEAFQEQNLAFSHLTLRHMAEVHSVAGRPERMRKLVPESQSIGK